MKATSKEPKTRRILMLSTSFPLREGSVSGIFVKHLAQALSKLHTVKVLTPDDNVDSVSRNDCFDLLRFRYAPRKWQILAHLSGGIPAQLRIKKYLILLVPFFLLSYLFRVFSASKRSDLIQANWAISAVVGSVAKKLRNIPLVTTLRGEDVKREASALNTLFLKLALRQSNAVVLVSHDMKLLLEELYPQFRHKYSVINNGVASFFLEGECSANFLAISQPAIRLIYVGSLIQRKNISFILNVLVKLKAANMAFEFTVIGDGNERSSLQRFVENSGLTDQVSFRGELPPSEIVKELKQHPVYISASLHEGRPNSVLEAMASGCCCILSDINGHKELCQENTSGLLFSLNDETNLYRVLMSIYKEPDRASRVGRLARSFIIDSGLTWQCCAEKYDALFERCLQR